MNRYAQTNLQLYGQLLDANASEHDLRLVHDAYELALRLFAGQYRGNGKPFVAHLVGVASILAAHWESVESTAAGLLHSIYTFGDFGDGTRGLSERKRREVRNVVGAAVEDLIARYTEADWSLESLQSFLQRPESLTGPHEIVLKIKLADVLEDHLDRGLEYIPAKKLVKGAENQLWTQTIAELARRAGAGELAAELRSVALRPTAGNLPSYLVHARASSFFVAPRSHRERLTSRLGRKVSRWWRKHSRVAG